MPKKIQLVDTGELLDFINVNISNDIDQWAWGFSLDLPDLQTHDKLSYFPNAAKSYVEFTVSVGAETWVLIAETQSSNGTQKSYSVSGRSITALLAEPHAVQLSQTWSNVMASDIVQEMCDLAGIVLDWQIEDWTVENYTCQNQYPIDVIKFFVIEEQDARLQALPDGTLKAVYWYSDNPLDLPDLTPNYEFDTDLLIFERSKSRENKAGYNYVLVTTDNAANVSDPTPTIEESFLGDDAIYIVRCNPFFPADVMNLQHKSGGNVGLFYIGEFTEQVEDLLIINDSQGQLSKQYDSLISVEWEQESAGSLSIAADGKVKCSGDGIGLVKILYMTRYLKYQASRVNPINFTLLITDDMKAVVSSEGISQPVKLKGSAGDKVADPIIVRTLSNPLVLRARGLAFLWRNGFDSDVHSLDIPYTGNPILPGGVTKVRIIPESLEFNCFVKSVSIGYGANGQTQQITLERPLT